MQRKIIRIDEAKCNGCGQCIAACAEGALQLVDGKARLVKEVFCDGFGDCIGECPTGALTIEVGEAPAFDYEQTKNHVRAERGAGAIQSRPLGESGEAAAQKHGVPTGGCPGLKMRFAPKAATAAGAVTAEAVDSAQTNAGRNARVTSSPVNLSDAAHGVSPSAPGIPARGSDMASDSAGQSELEQWPVQIHLVQPGAPYFRGRELLVLSTCAPVASAEIHKKFIRGRGVVIGCPKLDKTEGYAEKLAAILKDETIPSILVVRMEVPCCGGLTAIVREAVRQSGRQDLNVAEVQIALDGTIKMRTRI